ncbi:MAG TPA: hypothetical protein VMG12_41765 [Polyangiaceae bacterium]|nr:hypothetical protein [Polyangiaceae bacterium]
MGSVGLDSGGMSSGLVPSPPWPKGNPGPEASRAVAVCRARRDVAATAHYSGAMAASYDDAVAELYRAAHDAFVAERKRLAGELKTSGDKPGAARLSKLARPPISAWAVNQLWWQAREPFERLFAAAAKLRANDQSGANERRDALASLKSRAASLLVEAGHAVSEGTLRRVTTTLSALAASGGFDPDPPGALAADRDPPGFDLAGLGGFAAAAPAPPAAPQTAPPARKPDAPKPKPVEPAPAAPARSERADDDRAERDRLEREERAAREQAERERAERERLEREREERELDERLRAEQRRLEVERAARAAERARLEASLPALRGDLERREREVDRLRAELQRVQGLADQARGAIVAAETRLGELGSSGN